MSETNVAVEGPGVDETARSEHRWAPYTPEGRSDVWSYCCRCRNVYPLELPAPYPCRPEFSQYVKPRTGGAP